VDLRGGVFEAVAIATDEDDIGAATVSVVTVRPIPGPTRGRALASTGVRRSSG
jgi:hypothetical protein